jgi:hypothetical protein
MGIPIMSFPFSTAVPLSKKWGLKPPLGRGKVLGAGHKSPLQKPTSEF